MSDHEQLKQYIQQRLQQAQQDFMRESDGKTQCEIGRQGRDTPLPVKKIEGRMQALQDMDRIFSKLPDSDKPLHELLKQLLEKWERLPRLSPQWQVYQESGLEEIKDLTKQLPEK